MCFWFSYLFMWYTYLQQIICCCSISWEYQNPADKSWIRYNDVCAEQLERTFLNNRESVTIYSGGVVMVVKLSLDRYGHHQFRQVSPSDLVSSSVFKGNFQLILLLIHSPMLNVIFQSPVDLLDWFTCVVSIIKLPRAKELENEKEDNTASRRQTNEKRVCINISQLHNELHSVL